MKLLPDLPPHLRALFAPIVDTADAAFVVSLDCQFLAWGTRAEQLFGYAPPEVLGRYCYDLLPARDELGQCLCSVNCPMVTAARYGYSVPPSDAQICAKGNRPIWVRVSPIVLRAPYGAICAVLVLATDVSRYKLAEQLVRWLARRLDEPTTPRAIAVDEGAAMLRACFPDLTRRESEVLWQAVAGDEYHQIATALNIQPVTARNYLQRVLEKLGVRSLRQATLKAALALIAAQSSARATPQP
jgi:PAS domain S-box-containing protein